ncbi:AAA family ATPase [Legionella clemsonensis]|uniref:Coiled-coil protein n=1 Tax=Legionella clemsonensis TaxID=1867846 RepID=A0A222NZ59_9GAMM|nr:hypothetical protein [Legionella clemsonensis]ASQ44835.1 hypothetical protein clem_01345 [Legionella clemsonensis]
MSDGDKMPLQSQEEETVLNASLTPIEILKRLQEMHDTRLRGRPLPDKVIILLLLKKLPILSNFFHGVNGTGTSISKLVVVQGHAVSVAETAGKGFQWAGLGLALIDFFRIPLIYLAALLIGQEPPVTLNKNARWLYSTVLLTLTIIALAIPAAAPPIALVTAILGLGCSVFLLVKHVREYLQIQKTLREVDDEIKPQEERFKHLQTLAKALQAKIEKEPENFKQFIEEFAELEISYNRLKHELQLLYDKQLQFSQKSARMNIASVIDKTLAIGVSAFAVIGLAVSLAFPVIGLGIVAASAALVSAYILARILTPPAINLVKWLINKLTSKKETTITIEQQTRPSPINNLESTGLTMVKLYGAEATHVLEEQVEVLQQREQLEHKLLQPAKYHQNPEAFLQTIKEVALSAEPPFNLEEWREFLGREMIQPDLQLLQVSIGQIEMKVEEREQLLSDKSLLMALQEKGVDLHQITIKKILASKHSPALFQEGNDTVAGLQNKKGDFVINHQ